MNPGVADATGRVPRVVVPLIVIICLSIPMAGAQSAPDTVVEGATLIDGLGGPPIPDSVIVIRGERISAVGRAGQVKIPQGAQRINARGKYIIPGLIEAHTHFRGWMNELYIVQGVTTVFDADSPTDWILAEREAVASGKVRGPRIFTAGLGFRCSGKSCNAEDFSPSRLRQRVQQLAAAKVDHIYFGSDIPPMALQAIIEEAHLHGLRVTGPPLNADRALLYGIDGLTHVYSLSMGNTPEKERAMIIQANKGSPIPNPHLSLKLPEAEDYLRTLRRKNVVLIPMLIKEDKSLHPHQEVFRSDHENLLNNPDLDYIPKPILRKQLLRIGSEGVPSMAGALFAFGKADAGTKEAREFEQGYKYTQGFLKEFAREGGRILAASDPPSYAMPGLSLHHELQLLADSGMPVQQVLQAATLWPAEFLSKDADVGTIRAGRLADLLILDANPLDNIANTRRIHMVLKSAEVQELKYHHDFSNPVPDSRDF